MSQIVQIAIAKGNALRKPSCILSWLITMVEISGLHKTVIKADLRPKMR